MYIGQLIKRIRQSRGINQFIAAKEMKIGLSTLRQIEQGLPARRDDVVKKMHRWFEKNAEHMHHKGK